MNTSISNHCEYFKYSCTHCGNSFERPVSRSYKFCSRECYHASKVGSHRDQCNENPTGLKVITHICGWCGTEFSSKSSAGARAKYCTRSCQGYAFASRGITPKTLSPIDSAYIAAMIDGEGTVAVIDRTHDRPTSSRPTICLSVANTYKPLIEWFVSTTGVGALQISKTRDGFKQNYKWAVHSVSALYVLKQVRDYMKEKQYLADIAISHLSGAVQPARQLG